MVLRQLNLLFPEFICKGEEYNMSSYFDDITGAVIK